MNNFYQEFTIHPVGQGLFYSGIIKFQNRTKFRMVFDCGSLTKGACQDEVKLYKDAQFITDNVIDLLVISHFDADHVNQIGNLLNGNVKIKKLIMPFLSFEERLFLVMKHLNFNNGFSNNDDFVIHFLIDPLGTISENLDDDSEVLLIDNGPDSPINSDMEDHFTEDINKDSNGKRFEIKFVNEKKEIITEENIFKSSITKKTFKISDSEKGLLFSNRIKLMEFIFYKKTISDDQNVFYNEIANIFYLKHDIDTSLPRDLLLKKVVDEIKKIKSATRIKGIFNEAKKATSIKLFKNINVNDLNTTALCMLHNNLLGIANLMNISFEDLKTNNYWNLGCKKIIIHKFLASSRIEIPDLTWYRRLPFNRNFDDFSKFIYPNVLLTSDSFLLSEEQVTLFYNHYKNYWDAFWLFQIPHHGSDKSSDGILHAHIPKQSKNFINYGIGNRDKHPSSIVIASLVTTGNAFKTYPINQFSGLKFNLYDY